MKIVLLILLSLLMVNCGNKKFTANSSTSKDKPVHHDDTVIDDGNDDGDDDDDDVTSCPRYDLVVKSTHTTNKKLNFTYTFNAEMTFTSIKGKHKIAFSKAQYSPCSGSYTNTSILAALIPLQVTEDLTGEVLITDGAACVTKTRDTNLQVLDAATNTVIYDENDMKSQIGCEYGYTATGAALRKSLIDLADGVANAKGTACN